MTVLINQPCVRVLQSYQGITPKLSVCGEEAVPQAPDTVALVSFVFFETVSLCSPGCPENYHVDQAGFKFTERHLPLPLLVFSI